MPSRQNTALVHAIWGLGGVTLGASFALLVVKNWTPDWIEATGTWFGAIATVLTLLWAVRSFRSDQAERERSRKEEHQKEVVAAAEREHQRAKEANNVTVALRGGGGYGGDGAQMMDSVHVVVQNHSKYDAAGLSGNTGPPPSSGAARFLKVASLRKPSRLKALPMGAGGEQAVSITAFSGGGFGQRKRARQIQPS